MSTPIIFGQQNDQNKNTTNKKTPLIFGGGSTQTNQTKSTPDLFKTPTVQTSNVFNTPNYVGTVPGPKITTNVAGVGPVQTSVYNPYKPISNEAQLVQAPVKTENLWQKVSGFIGNLFSGGQKYADEKKKAEAMNAYAVLKVAGQPLVENRVKQIAKANNIPYEEAKKGVENLAVKNNQTVYDVVGLSPAELAKPGGNPFRNSLMEEVTKELGIRQDPTNADAVATLTTIALAGGLINAPLATVKAVGMFEAVNKLKSGLISSIKGEGFKPTSNYGLRDLYQGESDNIPVLLDTIDFLGSALAVGGAFKLEPKVTNKLTKDFITKNGLPKTIKITPELAKDIATGRTTTGYEADFLQKAGLTSAQWKTLVKEGGTVSIPSENLIYMVDKPYWATIKKYLGKTTQETLVGKEKAGVKITANPKQIEAPKTEIKKTSTTTPTGQIQNQVKPTRPPHQVELEKLLNAGKDKEAQALIDGLKDEYKAPMQKIMDVVTGKTSQKIDTTKALKQEAKKYGSAVGEITTNLRKYLTSPNGLPSEIEKQRTFNKLKSILGEDFIRNYAPIKGGAGLRGDYGIGIDGIKSTLHNAYKNPKLMKDLGISKTQALEIKKLFDGLRDVNTVEDFDKVITKSQLTDIYNQAKTEKSVIKPKEISVPREQLPVGAGEEKVSKLEARVKKAVGDITKNQIDELGLSTYKQLSNETAIKEATKYVLEKPDEALQVLEGKIETPKGLLRNAIYVAMQQQAVGDLSLATKLASISSTRLGQEIQILSQVDKNSPVSIINEIYKIKAENVAKKYKVKDIEQIKNKMIKQGKKQIKAPSTLDWASIIKEVRC